MGVTVQAEVPGRIRETRMFLLKVSGNLRGSGNTIRPDSVRGLRSKLAVQRRLRAPNRKVLSGDGSLQRMENVACRVVNLDQLGFPARIGWRRPAYGVQAL